MGYQERRPDGCYREVTYSVEGGVRLTFHQYATRKFNNGNIRVNIPFKLGLKGEWWSTTLGSLVVPVGLDANNHVVYVLVQRFLKEYQIIYLNTTQTTDDILMAACMVQAYLDGNDGNS